MPAFGIAAAAVGVGLCRGRKRRFGEFRVNKLVLTLFAVPTLHSEAASARNTISAPLPLLHSFVQIIKPVYDGHDGGALLAHGA